MLFFKIDSFVRLERHADGMHVFGGAASHKGVIPDKANISVNKLLSLDLSDGKLPFASDFVKVLPLYYPLKYGGGGAVMQYSVVSNDEIKILYMSDPVPDDADDQSVQVDAFPEVRFNVSEQAGRTSNWFEMTLGNSDERSGEPDVCRNSQCAQFEGEPFMDLIATIPPMPVTNGDDIWWDFEDAYMVFCFWYCRHCRTIVADNGAS